jgi:uncharacterized protein with FMN-binding domain
MITGIILAILFILTCLKFVTKRCNNKKLDFVAGKIHKVLGLIILITAIVHMIITLPLIKQRPFFMYIAGMIMVACALAAVISYYSRKKLKKNWIIIHRIATLLFILCLIFHVFIGVKSLNTYQSEIKNTEINNMNLKNVSDGNYIGEYDVGYIYAKVEVTIKNGKITDVTLLEHRNERGKKAESITDTIVKKQKIKVDAVSSATNSSKVIMKAVENAFKPTE